MLDKSNWIIDNNRKLFAYYCDVCKIFIRYARNTKLSKAAAKQLKQYSRTNFQYKGIFMRSGWEVKYAKYLDSQGIKWEYEPEFELSNGKIYIPDFRLDNGVIIEIKGFWRDDALEKWNMFCNEYPELSKEVLMKQELKDLGLEV